nr:hypothetical protein [Tanacetum cinerariifolium]
MDSSTSVIEVVQSLGMVLSWQGVYPNAAMEATMIVLILCCCNMMGESNLCLGGHHDRMRVCSHGGCDDSWYTRLKVTAATSWRGKLTMFVAMVDGAAIRIQTKCAAIRKQKISNLLDNNALLFVSKQFFVGFRKNEIYMAVIDVSRDELMKNRPREH